MAGCPQHVAGLPALEKFQSLNQIAARIISTAISFIFSRCQQDIGNLEEIV